MKTFRQAAQGQNLAITAELTIRREFTAADVLSQARALSPHVDAVQVNDNPYGWVQMSALTVASILLPAGIDIVPFMTARDRNRIALKSELMGLRTLGVGSVLLSRGHRVPKDHEIQTMTVFDTTGRELIALAQSVCDEVDLGPGRDFFIGTGARVFRPKRSWRAESLKARASAGAQFMQSQLCFNIDKLRRYMHMLVERKLTWDYSVIISLAVLPSVDTARWLRRNMSDSLIPKEIMDRLKGAEDQEREGINICAELMQEVAEIPGVSGINLMTMGDPDSIPMAIEASGLASKQVSADTAGSED